MTPAERDAYQRELRELRAELRGVDVAELHAANLAAMHAVRQGAGADVVELAGRGRPMSCHVVTRMTGRVADVTYGGAEMIVYDALCSCGWSVTSHTRQGADQLGAEHADAANQQVTGTVPARSGHDSV